MTTVPRFPTETRKIVTEINGEMFVTTVPRFATVTRETVTGMELEMFVTSQWKRLCHREIVCLLTIKLLLLLY